MYVFLMYMYKYLHVFSHVYIYMLIGIYVHIYMGIYIYIYRAPAVHSEPWALRFAPSGIPAKPLDTVHYNRVAHISDATERFSSAKCSSLGALGSLALVLVRLLEVSRMTIRPMKNY